MNLLLPGRQDPSLPFRYVSLTIGLTLLPAIIVLTGSMFSGAGPSLPSAELAEYRLFFYYLALFFICVALSAVNGILSFFDYRVRREFIVPIFGIATAFATVIESLHVAAVIGWIPATEDSLSFFWIVSRGFHCLVLIAGVVVCLTLPREAGTGADQRKTFVLFLTIIGITTAGILYYFLSRNEFPDLSFTEGIINRPVDIIVFAGYLFLLFIGTPLLYKRYPSAFAHALFLSMIPSVVAEGNMAFRDAHFPDPNFLLTISLKVLSYFLPFIGIAYNFLQNQRSFVSGPANNTETSFYLRLMNDISVATSRSESFNQAVADVIKVITNTTQFDLGNYYSYNREKGILEPSGMWYVKRDGSGRVLQEETIYQPLRIGEGLPGMVLETRKEIWINDFSIHRKMPRRQFFARSGIRTGLAIPVIANNSIIGVIEFFSFSALPEDESLMQIAPHLTYSLGHVKELDDADALRVEQEVHLKAAQQLASIGSWSLDVRTDRMHWSDEMFHIRELRVGAVSPSLEQFLSSIHQDDRELVRTAMLKAKESTEPVNFDYRLISSTGKIKYAIAHAELRLDEHGLPKTVYGTSQDISSRVIAERKYETLFFAAPDAIVLMDEKGIVTGWNDRAVQMFGYSTKEAVGTRLSNLIIPDKYRAAHEEGLRRFVDTGKARMVGREIELEGLHKDGTTIPVSIKISRLFAGEQSLFIGFIRDISERKRSEFLLYSIMNSALQALIAFKNSGKGQTESDYSLELSNQYAKALFETSSQALIEGRKLNEIFSATDLQIIYPRIRNVVKTGSAERFTYYTEMLEKWLDLKIVKIESGFAISVEDVTERKTIQRKFEENKHLLQQITDTVPSLLTVIDIKDLRPVYSNKQLASVTGHPDLKIKEVPGGFIKDLIHSEDYQKVIKVIDSIKQDGDDRTYEADFRLVTKAGEVRQFSSRTRIFKRDADGSVRLVLTIIDDVTLSKKAERQLYNTNKQLEAVFNQTFQLMAIIAKDGSVEKISRVALDYAMLDEATVIGKKFWEVKWWPQTTENETDLRSVVEKALRGEFVRTEIIIGDGKRHSYLDLSVKPMLNDEGEITFVIAEGRDVTAEKQAIEKIRTNEKLYRVMAENMPDSAVLLIDRSRTIQLIEGHSWSEMNFPKDKLIGRPLEEFLRGGLYKELSDHYDRAFNGTPTTFETEFGRRFFKVAIIPVYDSENEIFAVLAVYHDITTIKNYQKALEQRIGELHRSNKDLEQFAYIASHDLQEPLRKIRAFGDRLASKYKELLTGDGTLYLDRMENAAERMQRMINDLLTFSRVSRPKESFSETDLTEIVREVLSDLEITIEKKNATIRIVGELPVIEAIPTQMRQLFQNIIGNALKFTREGVPPEIIIEAAEAPDADLSEIKDYDSSQEYFKVSVSDNGIGFDEKYKDRIFTLFQRLHSKADYEGTGIGLSVCKKIVEFHNGLITVHSVPDQGSTFIFYLPKNQKKQNDDERYE